MPRRVSSSTTSIGNFRARVGHAFRGARSVQCSFCTLLRRPRQSLERREKLNSGMPSFASLNI